MQMHFVSCSTL